MKNPVIDSAAIESKPIESATAGTVSEIAVAGIFSAASSSSYAYLSEWESDSSTSLGRGVRGNKAFGQAGSTRSRAGFSNQTDTG